MPFWLTKSGVISTVQKYGNGFYRSGNTGFGLSQELLNNTWTPENTNAKFPMQFYNGTGNFTSGATIGSWAYTNMALFSATYWNIKNVTLGYKFSPVALQKISVESLRVYITAEQPFFHAAHSGIDPRMSLVGGMEVGSGYYLPMSSMSAGLNVTF